MRKLNTLFFVFTFYIMVFSSVSLRADIIYYPWEYNSLYNEKVALELELKSLNRQFKNEVSNLQKKISELENTIENLNDRLELEKKRREEDNRICADRIKELENIRDILRKKGSDREKELLAENKRLQEDCRLTVEELREECRKEREASIQEIAGLKSDYEKRIAELESRIANLNEELSSIKKLSEAQRRELERMAEQADELEKQLSSEIEKGEIRLKRLHQKIIINIDDKISFDSGSAKLKKEVLDALDKISNILSKYSENKIVIEGHTDNVPISTERFRDNWQLSTERALSVLRYLLKNADLDPVRVSAAGYGEYHPIVSNDTPENRALNRRVDIVVVPRVKPSR